jgi:serine/threonine-protein kinase
LPQDRAQRPDSSQGGQPLGFGRDDASAPGSAGGLEDGGSGGTYFLGRYRIVDEIGIGGMASVHLARMDGPGGFQKWVAIKKIHSHLVEDESFVQMFLDEARVAARISHPNVATVFDLGKHEDTYWIAMEYLHGEPLREVMRRTEELGTAMPPEIACRVIADAAEGLHAAHELLGKDGEKLGLVHRDVTPHNLFVTYDGVTKVVDFGIAKFSSRMSHTRAGTLKGKLAYMSPEQVHGEGIDRRTDIFALGVVLWELTTGQRLFRMESDLDTLAKVQECNVPRPSTLIRGYPVDLEKIVMKALAKNRAERFKTARELSRALQSLLMRRGLFIASDEVAAYTQSIFSDRIQKREAHLRWAAEVTQTINVDNMLSRPKLGAEYTGSEMQPSSSGVPTAAPRPAPTTPYARPISKLLPGDFNDPAVSLTAAPRRGQAEAPRPPRAVAPPRPAAGTPPTSPPPPISSSHPSDGDGPTIQASAFAVEEGHAAARAASLNEPPNLANDPPTIMGGVANQRRNNGVEVLEPEEFEEDGDETLVANTAKGGFEPRNGPSFGAPRAPAPAPVIPPQQAPTFRVPNTLPPGAPVAYVPSFTGEVPFTDPSTTGPQLGIPAGYGPDGAMIPATDAYGRPFGPGELIPRADPPSVPLHPSFARDNRTMQVDRVLRRPPMWVVAALSCSIALLIAGIVIAILSTTSSPAHHAPATTPTGATAAVSGPFTAARTAFNSVVAAPPPMTIVPPVAASTAAAAPAPPPPTPEPTPTPTPTPTATARAATPPTPAPVPRRSSAPGALTIVCLPKCDQIIDNGVSLGPGHIFNKPVPSGRHALVLSAPNGVKKSLQVDVLPDQTREVRISMERP